MKEHLTNKLLLMNFANEFKQIPVFSVQLVIGYYNHKIYLMLISLFLFTVFRVFRVRLLKFVTDYKL